MDGAIVWVGIAACLVQSALFSGLNLALLGLSRLQLEVEAKAGHPAAVKILSVRRNANFLLTTILWGNVSVNTLLTLLSDSIMVGVAAFAFSTVGITLVGEILPQAYFSRNAMRIGAALTPFIRFYQKVLYPVARPTALVLDWIVGHEEISYFRERELREVIRQHMHAEGSDLEHHEGTGALNFLALDDLPIVAEGEPIDPASVIALPVAVDLPLFPEFEPSPDDEFVQRVNASRRKWVILTDELDEPQLVLDADAFLRDVLDDDGRIDPYRHCHRPIVVTDPDTPIGHVMRQLTVEAEHAGDDVIDRDLILLWGDQRRIITGADLLGRIMRGVSQQVPARPAPAPSN